MLPRIFSIDDISEARRKRLDTYLNTLEDLAAQRLQLIREGQVAALRDYLVKKESCYTYRHPIEYHDYTTILQELSADRWAAQAAHIKKEIAPVPEGLAAWKKLCALKPRDQREAAGFMLSQFGSYICPLRERVLTREIDKIYKKNHREVPDNPQQRRGYRRRNRPGKNYSGR